MVLARYTKESMDLLGISRSRPSFNRWNLARVSRYAQSTNDMPKVTNPSLHEGTFWHFNSPYMSCKQLQDKSQMQQMFSEGGTNDQDIIKEDDHILAVSRWQRVIHGKQESVGHSRQAKGNNSELTVTKMSLECCFVLFTWCQIDLVINWGEV